MDDHHYDNPEIPISQEEYAGSPDLPNKSEFIRAWLGLGRNRKGSKFERIITVILLAALLLALIAWGIFSYNHIRINSDNNFKKINELTTKYDALQQKYKRFLEGNIALKALIQESSRQGKSKLVPNASTQRLPMQTNNRQRTIINLVGDGSLIKMSAGQPINEWESTPLVREGEINFYKQTYIEIETDGYYLLQAKNDDWKFIHVYRQNDDIRYRTVEVYGFRDQHIVTRSNQITVDFAST